ncbi:MAG: hypothetical protein WAL32_07695 [Terriglobales bacterium]
MISFLSNAAALWNALLLLAVIATLVGFLYGFVFRRLVRKRRIAGARDRRMLREAAQRESGEGTR